MLLFLLHFTKKEFNKEYKFNDEYYKTINSIKELIIIIALMIMTTASNFVLIIISYYCNFKSCFKKKKKFVEIVETSNTSSNLSYE